jgi:hypothetical protein
MADMLLHDISMGDICDDSFTRSLRQFDVILAHFTFSMWAGTPISDCDIGYKNVAGALKPGGRLLAALSEFHNPAITTLDYYHDAFKRVGLNLISVTRTWDVYDLSESERRRLIHEAKPMVYQKRVILAEYEKQTG